MSGASLPDLSARYEASELVTLTASWGVYHQAPTYRELRGRPEPGAGILGSLNRDLGSQTSIQTLVGLEYFPAIIAVCTSARRHITSCCEI
jgi:hypothetical protein